MSLFSVPPENQQAFIELAGLQDDTYATLAKILRETPSLLFPRRRIERALSEASLTPADQMMAIVDALLRLMTTRNSFREDDPSISDADIVANVLSEIPDVANASSTALEALQERLLELLSIRTLETSSRATQLLLEDEPTYDYATIVTDVRPIFDLAAKSLEGSIIVHKLTLYFSKDEAEQSFAVSMDEEEVGDLIEALQGAQRRAAVLREANAGRTPILEIGV
jgi:hypothetical protein